MDPSVKKSKKSQVQAIVESANKKVASAAKASCSGDESEEVSEETKKHAQEYADIRKGSKRRFTWDGDMPKVKDNDKRKEIRHYAKKHLLPQVPMVTVKNRYGDDIKCPTFPPETIILEVILPKEKWDDSDYEQFKYLDEQITENMKAEFPGFIPTARIFGGKKYTWHHHQDEGKMQLVENGIHSATQHSGGREIWAAERD